MRTRSQSRNRQQQVPPTFVESFNLEEPINNPPDPPVVTMANQRIMAQLLEALTEGYEDAIVVPEITADNFELKHGLLTLGPTIPTTSSFPKVVERKTEVTKDISLPTNNGSTEDVQPPVVQVQPQVPNSEPVVDVPFHDNSLPLDISKDQFEGFSDSNDDSTLIDDDSFSIDDIDYVEASPPDSELVSLEEVKDFHTEDGEIEDDILREKLSKINLLIAKIEALNTNPTPSYDFVTKSPSTFLNFFLEETNTFDNSIPESETFCFELEENSSGSTTTRSNYSLPDYKAFYFDDNHIEEKSSGSTTTHSDISLSKYDSFIFDLSNDPFPPADRSDFYHEEFADELAHIISPSEYDCLYFKSEPDPGELTSIVDSAIRENVLSTTNVNLPFEDDQSPLLAYVVWIFLPFLTYPVTPPYLLSCGNEDTIFDPGISVYHSFMPSVSHRSGTFMKFNVYPNNLNESPMEILSSTCSPMDQ
ncbi:hypothetical protein Tco_0539913 [Tanacetum coccineum]